MPGSAGRTRSLAGCATCRMRHVKCDETRPTCNNCKQSTLQCDGYLNRITFVLEGQPNLTIVEDASKLRRPLYNETQRHVMSELLVASTGYKPAVQILAEIDAQDSVSFLSDNSAKFFGPFGVFSASIDKVSSRPSLLPPAQTPYPEELQRSPLPLIDFAVTEEFHSQFTDAWFAGFNDEALGDLESISMPSGLLNDFTNFSQPPTPSLALPYELSLNPNPPLTSEAASLLAYFRDEIKPLLSSLKHSRKSPLTILHLPCAMTALAKLMMNEAPNHAQRAVLSAMLATSCFQRSAAPHNDSLNEWRPKGEKYLRMALEALKSCLQMENPTQKGAKYKEVLMAMISIIHVGVFSGDYSHTRALLLDAGKFIELKGIPKKSKSRKVRLLHHCYAFLRLFHESILGPIDTTVSSKWIMRLEERPTADISRPLLPVSTSLTSLEVDMVKPKDVELGQNDIHLETPGQWETTLYPAICGVPENFFLMLSFVTRLGNEKDLAQSDKAQQTLSWAQFSSLTKIIERFVLEWRAPGLSQAPVLHDSHDDIEINASDQHIVGHYMLALQHALVIYFYRRVYDMNPTLLQDNVLDTLKQLESCENEDHKSFCNIMFVWPAFIGACEALTQDLQNRFESWFDCCYAKSHISAFTSAKAIAQRVWARRAEQHDYSINWLQLGREERMPTMFL